MLTFSGSAFWNKPSNLFGDGYGGGNVDTAKAIAMSKKPQAANMNILVDLHYSDFWADPASQRIPTAWAGLNLQGLANEVETFTAKVLNDFKNAGVNVQAVQIGNELITVYYSQSVKLIGQMPLKVMSVATILKAGIRGAKSVNSNILTMIHLAEGGSFDVFNSFFSAMETNGVNYDLIGASYYPYYHGSLSNLQNNLNNTANKFKKPVIVAETSYGFTTADSEHASHIYNSGMEEGGKYLTSMQGQATLIRDVVQVLADVPENRGAGIFIGNQLGYQLKAQDGRRRKVKPGRNMATRMRVQMLANLMTVRQLGQIKPYLVIMARCFLL